MRSGTPQSAGTAVRAQAAHTEEEISLTDTTDLLENPEQDAPAAKTRRRATSGGGLSSLVLAELQSLAGDLGTTGTAKMRKSQLIEAIQQARSEQAGSQTATQEPATTPAPDEAR